MNSEFYKKSLALVALILLSVCSAYAQDGKLLWNYTESAPSSKPDNGLYYDAVVKDGPGTKNGLYGIKLNSTGYAYFVKPAVAGTLKLTWGPRDGQKESSIAVYEFTGEVGGTVTCGAKPIAVTPTVTELQTYAVELTAEQNNIYIKRESSVEQVLTKVEFLPTVARTFQDFEVNLVKLTSDFDTSTLPEGVTLEGKNRGDEHGYDNFKMTIPVDGSVKFTVGGCQYSNTQAKVLNSAGEEIASIDVKTPGCYHNGGVATWIYAGEKDVLTFVGAQYSPYLKVEAIEVSPCTVTFKDQNGKVIGTKNAFEGDELGEIPYTIDEQTIPESQVFRGWVYASGVKAKPSDTLSGNTTITAHVTPFEAVSVGSVQNYNLTSAIFYPEDHETISVSGAYYHDAQHGWAFATDGSVSVDVAGNAQVVLSLCKYSKDAPIKVTFANGNAEETIASGMVAEDGSVYTLNYKGEPTTITFTFTQGESYLHKVIVYNVEDFVTKDESTGYYIVPSGDAAALILAINSANGEEGAKIFLPNGTYDLGQTTGTAISGKNISLIGESAEGVIIMNAPDVKDEGLSKADLLYNTSEGFYMQDITLKNALDYYNAGSAGRAASFHDQGRYTIAKNVRLLSYQDTYYSHRDGSYFYWEGGEIHGTVDYICGGGNVYFNGITLVNESRSASSNSGDDTMTAAQTSANDKGYVFEGCTVESKCATFNFGRSWGTAKTVYLNTTINSGKLIDTRFNTNDMNSTPALYAEYNTIDKSGNGKNTPASNVLTFSKGGHFETVLTAEQAEAYSYSNFFNEGWDPKSIAAQADITTIEADAIYLVTEAGKFKAIVKGSELAPSTFTDTTLLRKANARGGFGAPASASVLTAIQAVNEKTPSNVSYTLAGSPVASNAKGVIIKNNKKYMIK